jgi:peptidoglycan hydrolase CwlO-like protein
VKKAPQPLPLRKRRKRRIRSKIKIIIYAKITVMKKFITVILIVFLGVVSFVGLSLAQGDNCSLSASECDRLQGQLDVVQEEIDALQKQVDSLVLQKNTLKGDVSLLTAQIAKAEKEIKQRSLTLSALSTEIGQKVKNISSLEQRIKNDLNLLANLLKKKSQSEMKPIYYLLLSSNDLGNLLTDIDDVNSINQGLQDLFAELRGIKIETQKEKEALDVKKNKELDAKYEVEQKKKVIAQNEAEKKQLLAITVKTESNYQSVLSEKQRQAEVIRSAMFDLRDAGGISFATALDYANLASAKTGVRPAMILAILSQESDLGKNIGSCYVSNLTTGDGVGKNTGSRFERVMYAPLPGSTSNRPNDTAAFEQITKALGLTWATTPVSCPLGATYYVGRGFGGAMGPSQFIPSTWQGFANRLSKALDVSLPNPWNPKHAIMATTMYLSDLGAGLATYTAERNAACKYYSGRACDNKTPRNYTYGDSVILKAEKFQSDIDFLKNI